MPYEIKLGGETYEFPDNISRDDALKAIMKDRAASGNNAPVMESDPNKRARQSVDEVAREASGWDRFWAGAGTVTQEPAQALQQGAAKLGLAEAPTEREIQEVRGLTDNPAGMAGNVAGNVALLANPMGKLEAGLKATANALPAAAQTATRYAVPTAMGAVEAGLTQPVAEGETKGGQMLAGGAFGAGGQAGVDLVGRTLATGLAKKSELGEELYRKGFDPTVGQASKGLMGNMLSMGENVLSALGINNLGQNRVGKQLVEKVSDEVTPLLNRYGVHMDDLPARGDYFKNLDTAFDDAYDSLLKGHVIPVPRMMKTGASRAANGQFRFAPKEKIAQFNQDLNTIFPKHSGRIGGRTFKDIRSKLTQRIRHYASSTLPEKDELVEAYKEARKYLDVQGKAGMPRQVWDALTELDTTYNKAQILGHAATLRNAGVGEGAEATGKRVLTARNIIDAVESKTPDEFLRTAQGHFMDLTEPVKEVLNKQSNRGAFLRRTAYGLAGVGTGATVPIAGGLAIGAPVVGLAGLSGTGARVLMGETRPQKALAKGLRNYVQPYVGTATSLLDAEED